MLSRWQRFTSTIIYLLYSFGSVDAFYYFCGCSSWIVFYSLLNACQLTFFFTANYQSEGDIETYNFVQDSPPKKLMFLEILSIDVAHVWMDHPFVLMCLLALTLEFFELGSGSIPHTCRVKFCVLNVVHLWLLFYFSLVNVSISMVNGSGGGVRIYSSSLL